MKKQISRAETLRRLAKFNPQQGLWGEIGFQFEGGRVYIPTHKLHRNFRTPTSVRVIGLKPESLNVAVALARELAAIIPTDTYFECVGTKCAGQIKDGHVRKGNFGPKPQPTLP
jgi:hypothetical protein